MIEIRGPVKLYDGRAEIILNRVSQLTGGSTLIPPLPKNYDVEKQGHYSAGRMHPPKKPAKTYTQPNSTATYGNEADASETRRSETSNHSLPQFLQRIPRPAPDDAVIPQRMAHGEQQSIDK